MVSFARLQLPAGDLERPEDLVQTVFSEAAEALSAAMSPPRGAGWLYERLRSRIIDRRRRARKQRAASLEDSEAAVHLLRDKAETPEELVVSRDSLEGLLTAVSDLIDRAALRYRLEGYSEREISAILSLNYPHRQVRERIRRAKRQLRRGKLDEWPSGK
jgi:RNA polymerase sigma factor (sigma-70 family)